VNFAGSKWKPVQNFAVAERWSSDPTPKMFMQIGASGHLEGVDYKINPEDVRPTSKWYTADPAGAAEYVRDSHAG
jgi:hypothetical protein